MKKSLFFILFASLFFALPTQAAATLPDGLLIKSATSPAVYFVSGGLRRPFPLQSVYESRFGKYFSTVVTVDATTLASYPLGKNMTFAPGSLIKITTNPKVYHVLNEQGVIDWIQTEETFLALGFSFKDVKDVPDTFFIDYQEIAVGPESPASSTSTPGAVTSTPSTPTPPESPVISDFTTATPDETTLSFSFMTDRQAKATLTLTDANGTLVSTMVEQSMSLSHTITVKNVIPAQKYSYRIVVVDAENKTSTKEGTALSKTEILVEHISDAPHEASLFEANVPVTKFKVTNKASSAQTLTTLYFVFESDITKTDNVAKTIYVYRLIAGTNATELIANKFLSGGTSIRNQTYFQKFNVTLTLDPGEDETILVVINGLQNISRDENNIGHTWKSVVQKIDGTFANIYIEPGYYGDLIVK